MVEDVVATVRRAHAAGRLELRLDPVRYEPVGMRSGEAWTTAVSSWIGNRPSRFAATSTLIGADTTLTALVLQ
jgi:hypothetical protein